MAKEKLWPDRMVAVDEGDKRRQIMVVRGRPQKERCGVQTRRRRGCERTFWTQGERYSNKEKEGEAEHRNTNVKKKRG